VALLSGETNQTDKSTGNSTLCRQPACVDKRGSLVLCKGKMWCEGQQCCSARQGLLGPLGCDSFTFMLFFANYGMISVSVVLHPALQQQSLTE